MNFYCQYTKLIFLYFWQCVILSRDGQSLPKLRSKNGYSIKTLAFRRKHYTFADEQEPKI